MQNQDDSSIQENDLKNKNFQTPQFQKQGEWISHRRVSAEDEDMEHK